MVRIKSNSRIYLSEGIISTFKNCSIWTRNWLLLDEQLSKVKIYLEHFPSLYSLIKNWVLCRMKVTKSRGMMQKSFYNVVDSSDNR